MDNSSISEYSHQVSSLLRHFSDEDILSLANTITQGMLKSKISSREDALKAIITYSEDLTGLLRRKLFTKERLLEYLYENSVPVKLPTTKHEIITKIIELWTKGSKQDAVSSSSECTNVQRTINESETAPDVKLLSEKFCEWFYSLLNENQLIPDHFFPDAILEIRLLNNDNHFVNTVENNPEEITSCIQSIKYQNDLYFNPNLTSNDGLKAQMDPHGLVLVKICGTLHSNSICVGIFEQMFALARDPFAENNWKIKRTELSLKTNTMSQITDT